MLSKCSKCNGDLNTKFYWETIMEIENIESSAILVLKNLGAIERTPPLVF